MTLIVVVIAVICMSAQAQETWTIDPKYSVVVLSLGSEPNLLQMGLTRVSGEVVFDSSDSDDPTIRFETVPRSRPEAQQAEMNFTSKRCTSTIDGKLLVIGKLSVTRVERWITANPTEDYAGQQYGLPMARTETHEITLVFPNLRQRASQNGQMRFTGNTSITRENFPQLLNAITLDDWPTQLVNDEKCEYPSTIGEDYHGPQCTGTVIARIGNAMVASGTGDDFSGFNTVVVPDRNQATVILNLQLKKASSAEHVAAK